MTDNPLNNPDGNSLARECNLARGLIGSGVTALGKASYATGIDHYYTAFFGLSVGIERLAKLILVADYIIKNNGNLPSKKTIKSYGHNLIALLDEVDKIATRHDLKLRYPRPCDDISKSIISCLDSFADAGKGRYANFNTLGDPNFESTLEPIKKWWEEVAEPILEKHYFGKQIEIKVKNNANAISAVMEHLSIVYYTDETGRAMQDLKTASERTGQTEIVQKFGRFYTLTVVRWMADVFDPFSSKWGYDPKFSVLFGHYEFFNTFRLDNDFLKNRKRWPL